ncbi:ABC transporter permease [Saccharolobus solfataricus]|nr:ABC transporter permease [Saccharolobus solfataricus]AKA75119.1 ABC transporter permease [Saccharolobus solfataricus]AKA77813.1 ABC transporter permease [Saccharolobus solfataricus]AKA80507.1 ABC transporter permease [Saccharolobus solfataricus]AZF69566.1 ABC transporter permease [Saccharolobus solfataricus]AZF72186.1 ABC transporter permease [Saccharolobus solfataricus]
MRIPPILRLKLLWVALIIFIFLLGSIAYGFFTAPKANPYTPAGQYAASPYAVPSWASIFYGNLPPDIKVPNDYDLIAAKTASVINYWHLSNFTFNGDAVIIIYNSSYGPKGETNFQKTLYSYGNTGNGSVEIIIEGTNPLNLTLYHDFLYNYLLPRETKFGDYEFYIIQASISAYATNAYYTFNGYVINPSNATFWLFLAGNYLPTNLVTLSTVFKYLGNGGWNYILASSASAGETPWFYTSNIPPNESAVASVIMLQSMFNSTGNYKVEFTINYIPNGPNSKLVVYLSDLYFEFLGSRYGVLGTDNNGASVFAEYSQGGIFDLELAILAGLAIVFIGAVFGLFAGYYGGKLDQILTSFTDFILLLPGLAILIVLITIFQQIFTVFPKDILIIIVLVILSWPPTSRTIRGQVLQVRNMAFVEAAKALGMSNMEIIRKHVLRHVFPIIIAQLIFDIPAVIGIESALDFLGIGILKFPTWGNMLGFSINASLDAPGFAWWWILTPGIALFLLGVSLFYIGEAITRYYGSLVGETH